MRTFAVNIPTKSYLRKYVHKRYGFPIMVNNRTVMGSVLIALLNKKVYSDRSNALDLYNTYCTLNDVIECVVAKNEVLYGTIGLYIDPAKALQINRYFAGQFEEDVYLFCQQNITNNGKHPGYDQALEKFARIHGIEFDVDITFEALKKMEYRYRKKLEHNLTANVPASKYLEQNVFHRYRKKLEQTLNTAVLKSPYRQLSIFE